MLTVPTLLRVLLGKADSEIAVIRTDAEQVVLGAMSSISALSQSTTFDREDAAVILEACQRATELRAADPAATASSVPAPTAAHSLRRNRQYMLGC